MKPHSTCFSIALVLAMAFGGFIPRLHSQDRMNDKDLEKMFDNLKNDSKKFESAFDDGVEKSTIRKTSQEKEAKTQVESFRKQAEAALNKFKKDQHPETELAGLITSGTEIDKLLTTTPMGDKTDAAWAPVKKELSDIAVQFRKEFPPKSEPAK
jgi:hypothetical protein